MDHLAEILHHKVLCIIAACIFAWLCPSSAQESVMRKTVNLKLVSWKGGQAECGARGAWLTSRGDPVSDIPGFRYVYSNGTLYFPPFDQIKSAVHTQMYTCSTNVNGKHHQIDYELKIAVVSDPARTRRMTRDSETVILQERFSSRVVDPGVLGGVQLECGATGASKIIWNRDGHPLPSHLIPQQSTRHTPHGLLRVYLNITQVTPEDAGLYSCVALSQDNASSAQHSARLDVYGPPYIRNMLPIKILAGSKASIYCPYYGYPISKVKWDRSERISGSIFERRYKRNYNQEDEGWLRMDHVSHSDNGVMYTCTVSSPTGEMAKRGIEIIVMEPPILDELSFGSNIKEGEIAKVVCSVKGGDVPVFFSWLKDGASISAALRIEERNLDVFSILLIRKVGLQHCGIYTCIVANQAGRVNQTAELFIKVAPKWIEEPQNTSVVVGRVGSVGCSASGYPQPQVHWMKKEDNLGTWRPVLELIGSGLLGLPNGSLIFETVTLNHEGMYSCTVDNGVPLPLNKAIWISVKKPVSFEGTSTNMTTRAGHPTTIMCEAFGDNPIRITWNLNGVSIENLPMRLTSSSHQTVRGAISEILIGSTVVENSGLYQCKANNPHGTAAYSINLIVKEPPGLPAEVAVEAVWGRSARMGWRTPTGTQPVGYTLQYTPHGHTPYWDTATVLNVTSSPGQQRHQCELTRLQPATTYATRICSVGEIDSSPYTRSLLFTTLEEAPEEAPSGLSVETTNNPGELSLSWLPPPTHTLNGNLLGYIIRAVPQIEDQSEKNIHVREVRAGRKIPVQIVISELLKSTRYGVTVSCYNSAGQGPPSTIVHQQTRGGVPEVAPSSVDCAGISSTSLRISWRPLSKHLQGGAMLGYTLFYSSQDGIQQNHTTIHNEVYLKGLSKFTNYSIEVAGYCKQGHGPLSSTLICSTMEDLPSAPANIKGIAVSSDAIIISWKPPLHPNGHLTHYSVYFKPPIRGESNKSFRVPITYGSKSNIRSGLGTETMVQLIRQLQSGQRYEAWVTASSSAGEGEHSRHVHAEPSITGVTAGVASLGGEIWAGAGQPLLLSCYAVGNPQPVTKWYHNNLIITYHPRYSLEKDDSLLIRTVDSTMEGNYTCQAQNLFGSDRVEYYLGVLPIPSSPILHVTASGDSVLLEWETPSLEMLHPPPRTNHTTKILGYSISWHEAGSEWMPDKDIGLNFLSYTIHGLRCGTTYEVRLVIRSTAGNSKESIVHARTHGDALVAPVGDEWIWTNATHIWVQTDSWEKEECGATRWSIDYRPVPTKAWLLPNTVQKVETKKQLLLGEFQPGNWYQLRVTATNAVGATTTITTVSTKTLTGEEIGPYSEPLDTSILVIVCSSILLFLCMLICIFAAIQKHRHRLLCGSGAGSVYKERNNSNPICPPPPPPTSTVPNCTRLYTSPMPLRKPSKTNSDMFEISPYAQFSMGFQTFGHVDNQDRPGYVKSKQGIFSTETSFQMGSESEDSDSLSKSATMKSIPHKTCRVQYHRSRIP